MIFIKHYTWPVGWGGIILMFCQFRFNNELDCLHSFLSHVQFLVHCLLDLFQTHLPLFSTLLITRFSTVHCVISVSSVNDPAGTPFEYHPVYF